MQIKLTRGNPNDAPLGYIPTCVLIEKKKKTALHVER